MSITLRAHVSRAPHYAPFPWRAVVAARADDSTRLLLFVRRADWVGTHAEAIESAHALLAAVDAELMDNVNASRAHRRTTWVQARL